MPGKGLQDIKTLAAVRGTGVHSNERHKLCFQIASLELERTRRRREQDAALERSAVIQARLDEIDALIRQHHETLDDSLEPTDLRRQDGGRRGGEPAECGDRRQVLRY